MTFSVAARCARTGQLGVAVSTAVPAVGAICPFVAPGVGAIATQSWVNPYLGIDGLTLLAQGLSAPEALARLIADDPGRKVRQVGIVDAAGRVAQHSGDDCTPWFGEASGDGFACQGNMLTGAEVIAAMAQSMEISAAEALDERLMRALEAGQAAGGDMRGRQSASLKIHGTEEYPLLDLRVDAHEQPVAELRRVLEIARRQLLPFVTGMSTRTNPHGELSEEVTSMLLCGPDDRL